MINDGEYLLIREPVNVDDLLEPARWVAVLLYMDYAAEPNGDAVDDFIFAGNAELSMAKNECQILLSQSLLCTCGGPEQWKHL